MYHYCIFISEIKVDCELFQVSSNCSNQCTPLVNNIQLPAKLATNEESVLTSIDFSIKGGCKIFK